MPKNSTTVIRVCLLVLAGGFAAQHSRVPVSSSVCVALFAAVVLLLTIRHVRWFAFLLFGFTLFMQAGNRVIDSRLEPRFSGDSMRARVRIADFPKSSGDTAALLVEPVGDSRLPRRSRVTWFEPHAPPAIGDVWELELRLRRPYGSSNPGLFSLEDWMFRQDLHASGYVVGGKRNRLEASGSLTRIERYRRDFVARAIDAGGDAAPVLAAIGVGSRHLIGRDQWDRYARTGTSHLMAISGLHIGLAGVAAAGVLALLAGLLRFRGNYLKQASIVGALVAALYAAISGFAVPSQRATVMLGLVTLSFFLGRRVVAGRIVALSAIGIFIVDPLAILAPGFVLSFGAVLALLWFAQTARIATQIDGRRWRLLNAALQISRMQIALLFGLLPMTAIIFHRISFAAPLANLIIVPIFSLVAVPLTLLSMLLHAFWDTASGLLLRIAAMSVEFSEQLIERFAAVPGASFELAGIGGDNNASLCFVLLPILWLVLPRGWPGRRIALLGLLALLVYTPAGPPRSCIDAHVLDVGQGLSVVVQSNRRTLVFDTGASYRSGGSVAEQVVLPFLRHRGIRRVDWLVVSHGDDDHAGGTAALLRAISVQQILAGEPLANIQRRTSRCVAGQSWSEDGVAFRFLYPEQGDRLAGNNASCVLSIGVGDYRLILTGDVEAAGEQSLVQHSRLAPATVIVIPHHGSLTSSSPAFVNRTRPDIAIASVGKDNRWGFPKERVVKRWRGAGATVLDTASSGAVSFRLCARDGLGRLQEERVRRQRFWHESADL